MRKPAPGFFHDLVPTLADYYARLREAQRAQRAHRELEALRERFRGQLSKDLYNDHFPKLTYRVKGLDAQLAVWPESEPLTRLRVHFGFVCPLSGSTVEPFPTCAMVSASLASRELHPRGLVLMRTGDSVLDASFTTLVAEPGAIGRLLGRVERASILELYYLVPHHTLGIGLERERVTIKKLVPAEDLTADLLARMGGLAAALVARWVEELTLPEGAVIALTPGSPVEESIRCRICGQTMFLDGVLCRRCDTPHHRDCWEYNGRCAVYGCPERTYRVPSESP